MALSPLLLVVIAVACCSAPGQHDFAYLVKDPSERQLPFLLPLHGAIDNALGATAYLHPGREVSYNNYVAFSVGKSQGWGSKSRVTNTWLGLFNVWIPFPIDLVLNPLAEFLDDNGVTFHHTLLNGRIPPAWQCIIAANIAVYLLWFMLSEGTMEAVFATSVRRALNFWTWPLAAFSHASLMHLARNMFLFYQVAPRLERSIGSNNLWIVYVVSGTVGSLFSIVRRTLGPRTMQYASALGASGAIMGVLSLYAIMFPKEQFLAPNGQPIPVVAFVGLHVLLDLLMSPATVDVAAHVGGVVTTLYVLPALGFHVSAANRFITHVQQSFNSFLDS